MGKRGNKILCSMTKNVEAEEEELDQTPRFVMVAHGYFGHVSWEACEVLAFECTRSNIPGRQERRN